MEAALDAGPLRTQDTRRANTWTGANTWTATQTFSASLPINFAGDLTTGITTGRLLTGNSFYANQLWLRINGSGELALKAGIVQARSIGAFCWGSSTVDGSPDTFLYRGGAAATVQLGADAAGVTNQTIKACDRITSDGVGANLTIAGGRNRGASAGGSVIVQTSPAAGAGVTGTLATRLTVDSNGNLALGATPSVADAVVAFFVANATTVPTTNPTGGGVACPAAPF